MKKLLALFLIFAMLLPLAACGERPEEPAPAPVTPTEPEPAPAAEPEPEPEPEPIVWTEDDARNALVQTALAYYYHNPYVQYDNMSLTEVVSSNMKNTSYTAEDAEADEYVYTVCSDFAYRLWKEVAGWTYTNNSSNFLTNHITGIPASDPLTVYKAGGEDGEQDREKALKEALPLLEPGDFLTYYTSGGGHTMIYVGDLDGDGRGDLLHSTSVDGGRLERSTGDNPIEPKGSIEFSDAEDLLFNPNNTKRYLGKSGVLVFNIIDPLRAIENIQLSPSAQMRLKYPFLEVHQTFDRPQFQDVQIGEYMTCKIALTNHSETDYTGIPVSVPIPEGQEYATGTKGITVENGAVSWTVDVPAGKTVEVSFKIKGTGKAGDTFTFEPGTVDTLPLRRVTFRIGGKRLNDAQKQALEKIAAGKLPQSLIESPFSDLDTVNIFYRDVLGMDPQLPKTAEALFDAVTTRKSVLGSESKMRIWKDADKIDETVGKMLLSRHLFGQYAYVSQDTRDRVIEFLPDRYLPGDVFVSSVGTSSSAYIGTNLMIQICLGNDKVLVITPDSISVEDFAETIGRNVRCDFGVALRPTQAYENLLSSAPAAAQALTDIPEAVTNIQPEMTLTADRAFTEMLHAGDVVTYTLTLTNTDTAVGTGTVSIVNKGYDANKPAEFEIAPTPLTGGSKLSGSTLVFTFRGLNPGESRSWSWSAAVPSGCKHRGFISAAVTCGDASVSSEIVTGGPSIGTKGYEEILNRFTSITESSLADLSAQLNLPALATSNKVYQKLFGYLMTKNDTKSWSFPDSSKNIYDLFFTASGDKYTPKSVRARTDAGASPSGLVLGCFGGTKIEIPEGTYLADLTKVDFEVGDVIIRKTGADEEYSFFIGDGKFVRITSDKSCTIVAPEVTWEGIEKCDLWMLFRVSQGLTNANTRLAG